MMKNQGVRNLKGETGVADVLPDLARLKAALKRVEEQALNIPETDRLLINPSLELLTLSWRNLIPLLNPGRHFPRAEPEPGDEMVLLWKEPESSGSRVEVATDEALLALKIVVEGIALREAAQAGNVKVSAIDAVMERAVRKGILIAPPTRIRREEGFPAGHGIDRSYLSSEVFTLQWHITQACDLHCRHCYDRSERSSLQPDRAVRVLDDLYDFCRTKGVRGQVSFSGGNPFLYPHFAGLYRAASERGFAIAVLGNPVGQERLEEVLAIEKPLFYQVSLEGLREHNDMMRGVAHFDRTLDFLDLLREREIYSMVMLTLTKDNIGQVIPLSGLLRNRTDLFTFNRLSMVGEGANLSLPSRDGYAAFLGAFTDAAEENPVMGLKDNLINIVLRKRGAEPFGGCTGHGCGAAFNFLTLLPDGEVHACRKFPSGIGNIFERDLASIYDSGEAVRYRRGCKTCEPCPLRPVCGGCLAASHSHGLDPLEERDPYCFIDDRSSYLPDRE